MKRKRVLVAPLDWGLGHATRCVPIIQELLKKDVHVYVASSGASLTLLKNEFPSLSFFELPPYEVRYGDKTPLSLALLFQLPKFLRVIRREHSIIENLIRENQIDYVISDNRYGCGSRKVPSFFITHQVNILLPAGWRWLSPLINDIHHRHIKNFTECWIPDDPHEKLSGAMTLSPNFNSVFIGFLSRFEKITSQKKFDVLFLLSGPEPQRSIFENILIEQARRLSLRMAMVRGLPDVQEELKAQSRFMLVKNHLSAMELQHVIAESEVVVSRSGYSTIMDLIRLGSKAIFVPTPGQTEQEYLAKEIEKRDWCFFQPQAKFQLAEALILSKKYSGFSGRQFRNDLLSEILDKSISKKDA